MSAQRDGSGRRPLGNVWPNALGRWPRLVLNGPLALNFRANGAPPSQPGATPQVTERKPTKG